MRVIRWNNSAHLFMFLFFCLQLVSMPMTGRSVEISTGSLPEGMEMVPYSAQLEAVNGVQPYSWSVPSGFLETEGPNSFEIGESWSWYWIDCDDCVWQQELQFDFPFYGEMKDEIWIGSNGTLSFDWGFSPYSVRFGEFLDAKMIAPLWDDLWLDEIGIESGSDFITIVYWGSYLGSSGIVTFSITLFSDGRIQFKYGEGNLQGGFIGISAGNGEDYHVSGRSQSGAMNYAPDLLFSPVGLMPHGLSLSEDGVLSGTPMKSGTYKASFIVSDSVGETDLKELEITIAPNPNTRPVIDGIDPDFEGVDLEEKGTQTFSVTAHDPEGAPLSYRWTLSSYDFEDEPVGDGTASYTFNPDWGDRGDYTLTCYVSDDLWTDVASVSWDIWVIWSQPSTLSGQVFGAGGVPLANALVVLRDQLGWTYRTRTNSEGAYLFDYVSAGYYTIKVGAEFFADIWYGGPDEAEIVEIPGDSAIEGFNFTLAYGQSPALVNVTSDPPGAEIYLDHHSTGKATPAVIDVGEVGNYDWLGYLLAPHVISLKPEGGVPRPSSLSVPAKEAETVAVHFDLTSNASGSVSVQTTPTGADVFVDYADASLGLTPIVVGNLAPGSHTILLNKDGFLQPRPIFAWVEEDQTTEVAIPLEQAPGESEIIVEVDSSPQEIPIFVNYIPTTEVTSAVIGLMDPASHSGLGWHSASHTVLLREEGAPPLAPRYVPEKEDPEGESEGEPVEEEDLVPLMYILLNTDPAASRDSNGDGIPDWLWLHYGYDPQNPPNVNEIADASGMTYGDKLQAGLIPGDPDSKFQVREPVIGGDPETGREITFTFDTVPGRRYVLQGLDDTTTGGWASYSGIITATGFQTEITVPVPDDTGSGFFRLIVLAP